MKTLTALAVLAALLSGCGRENKQDPAHYSPTGFFNITPPSNCSGDVCH